MNARNWAWGVALVIATFVCTQGARGQATVSLVTNCCGDYPNLIVDVRLDSTSTPVTGGQFFLQYDNTKLDFLSMAAGDAPFTIEVFESVNEGLGTIDYAVGAPPGSSTTSTTVMARITFAVLQTSCMSMANIVTFRPTGPNGALNQLSDDSTPSQPITPLTLNNLGAFVLSPPTRLTLKAKPCNAGQLVVDIDMAFACTNVTGGQYFLLYDNTKLDFVSANPGPMDFNNEVFEFVNEGAGTIDYATGVPSGSGTQVAQTMARITFNILMSNCAASDLVEFRIGPNGAVTTLSDSQIPSQPILPLDLFDLPPVTLDITPPSVSAPANITLECGDPIPPAPPTVPASDNCDPGVTQATFVSSVPSAGNCPMGHVVQIITRTWTVTDACGNVGIGTQIITIEDNTPPVITLPANASEECDGLGNLAGLNAWKNSATANDVCTGAVTPVFVEDSNVPGCGGTFVVTGHWTATDPCMNTATSAQRTFTVVDTTAPTISPPANASEECDGLGNLAGLNAWKNSAGANDVCSGAVTPVFVEDSNVPGCGGTFVVTGHWTATDPCMNTATSAQRTFTVVDTTAPTITPPANASEECDGLGNLAGLNAWKNSATANDVCSGPVAAVFVEDSNVPGCGGTFVITGHWTATDPCNNSATSAQRTFTVVDTTAPVITPPANASEECDGLGNLAGLNAWKNSATANDVCSGPVAAVFVEDSNVPGCGGTFVVTGHWTATDPCMNTATSAQRTFTVVDTTAPTITPPANASEECDGLGNLAGLNAWKNSATANDVCSGAVTPVFVEDSNVPGCGGTFVVTGHWTATDACNNTATSAQRTFTVVDTTAPSLSIPANASEECDGLGNLAGLNAWKNSATANDVCSGAVTPVFVEDSNVPGCGGTFVITGHWTATDPCNNTATSAQRTFTVVDTTAPTITPPANASEECDGLGNLAGLNAWKNSATANDVCSGAVTPVFVEDSNVPGCGGTFVVTGHWTATDPCMNSATSAQRTFTVVDTTGPMITSCPGNINVHAAAGSCDSAPVTYSGAASDTCSGPATITFVPPSGSTFPPGTTTVTMTATDTCGNMSTCTFDVINDGMYELVVDVELGGGIMAAGPYTRAITFQLWSGASLLHTTCQTFSFASGNMPAATLLVPCNVDGYTCITARDRLHTLRRTISPLPTVGPQYLADFTGAEHLIGGNLNDDQFIDILDFGIYTLQDLGPAPGGADTTCAQSPPFRHADINGDGIVQSIDYSFIANHFLEVREANCDASPFIGGGGGGPEGGQPRQSISVRELQRLGYEDLVDRDLNGDGVFDLTDVTLWQQGVRPKPPAPKGTSPTRTGM